ncbi:hypothetical protein QW131_30740 [Roseibium salinum]|nr:hypothetical protein [Roseibium salinum]
MARRRPYAYACAAFFSSSPTLPMGTQSWEIQPAEKLDNAHGLSTANTKLNGVPQTPVPLRIVGTEKARPDYRRGFSE